MVVTTLAKEAAPLIRYRTRDITRIIPGRCTCGVHPAAPLADPGAHRRRVQVPGGEHLPLHHRRILSSIPGLGSEYQIHLTRDAEERERMRLVVERAEGVEPGRAEELQPRNHPHGQAQGDGHARGGAGGLWHAAPL